MNQSKFLNTRAKFNIINPDLLSSKVFFTEFSMFSVSLLLFCEFLLLFLVFSSLLHCIFFGFLFYATLYFVWFSLLCYNVFLLLIYGVFFSLSYSFHLPCLCNLQAKKRQIFFSKLFISLYVTLRLVQCDTSFSLTFVDFRDFSFSSV